MNRPIRIAVVGPGLVAQRFHLPAYVASDEVEVAALVSDRVEAARAVAARFGNPPVLASIEEVLADPAIDAVDICTPNALHAPMAIAAARAGKHVLVEKPMATRLEDADAMIAAARSAGVVLMVAHNLRYAPIFETMERIVREGTLGRLLAVRGVMMHAGPDEAWGSDSAWFWQAAQAGGGALLDLGIHMIDLVRWLVGRPVVAVAAMMARTLKPTPFDDNALALLRFEGDVLASVQASWTARPRGDRQLVVQGEHGQLVMDAGAPQPLTLHLRAENGTRTVVPEVPAQSLRGNPYVHFARAIKTGEPPLTTGEEGRASLAVTLAAYEAARSSRTIEGRWG